MKNDPFDDLELPENEKEKEEPERADWEDLLDDEAGPDDDLLDDIPDVRRRGISSPPWR